MPIVRVTFPKDRTDAYSLSTDHAIVKNSDGLITSFVLRSNVNVLHTVILSPKGLDFESTVKYVEAAAAAIFGAATAGNIGGTIGLMRNAKLGRIGTIVGGLCGGLFTLVADLTHQSKKSYSNHAYYAEDNKQLIYDGLIYEKDVWLVDENYES